MTPNHAKFVIGRLAEVDYDNDNDTIPNRVDAMTAIGSWMRNPELEALTTGITEDNIRDAIVILSHPGTADCYREKIIDLQDEEYSEEDENAVHVSQMPDITDEQD